MVAPPDPATRDPEARAAAEQLREALNERVEAEHTQWTTDLERAVAEGRTVRALRLSGRPVKAGSPLPGDTGQALVDQTAASLTADTGPDRWATVLDALAYSPVRNAVTPESMPSEPNEKVLAAVRAVADRLPAIAELFGIDPASVPKKRRRRGPAKKAGAKVPPPPDRAEAKTSKPAEAPDEVQTAAPEATPDAAAPTEPEAEVVVQTEVVADEAAQTEVLAEAEVVAEAEEIVEAEAEAEVVEEAEALVEEAAEADPAPQASQVGVEPEAKADESGEPSSAEQSPEE